MTIAEATAQYRASMLRGRRAHLAYEKVSERQLWRIYKKSAGKIGTKIMIADTPLTRGSLRTLLDSVTSEIERLDNRVLSTINTATDQSVKMGLDNSIDRLSVYKDFMPASFAIDPTSSVFNSIYHAAVRALAIRPLDGIELSERVWNVHKTSITQIRKLIAKGYLEGESSYKIAQEVRRMLLISDSDMRTKKWKLFFKEHPPGRGVYKSAYKNTERIIRTETNNAFRLAQSEYAASRAWITGVKWNRVAGALECGECLIAGTQITTMGGLKSIENINIGERVLTHTGKWQKVIRTFVHTTQEKYLVKLVFQAGNNHIQELSMTRNHPVLTEQGWILADDLQMGCHGFYYSLKHFETFCPFLHDDVCKQESNFVENETLLHEQKAVEGLNDVNINQLKNSKDIYFLNYLMPILQHKSACAELHYIYFHLSSLDYQMPYGIQKQINESKNYVLYQFFFLLAFLLKHRTALNNIFAYYNKKQISCHNLGIFSEQRHNVLSDMLLNRIYGFHNFLNNIPFCKLDKYDMSLPFGSLQNNIGYKNEALNNGWDGHSKIVSTEFLFHNIHNILSYFNNSINNRACPEAKLIKKTYIESDNQKVYNLEVEKDNSYIANGMAVHNCDEYASYDSGLGPGVYKGGEIPSSHANCLCFLTEVIKEDVLKSGTTSSVINRA